MDVVAVVDDPAAFAVQAVQVPVKLVIANVGVALNVGEADPLVKFPNTLFAAALVRENVSAGVVVAVATEVVKSGERVPALKDVTVPEPPPPPPKQDESAGTHSPKPEL